MTCRLSTRSTGDALAYAIAVVTEVPMNLYLIQFDGEHFYVEAPDYSAAIAAWSKSVKAECGDGEDFTDQPESVTLLHDAAVIR